MDEQNITPSKLETSLSIGTGLIGAGLTGLCLYEPTLSPYIGLGAISGAVIAGIIGGRIAQCPSGSITGAAVAGVGVITQPDCSIVANTVAACAASMCASIAAVAYIKNPVKFARNTIATALIGSAILYGGNEIRKNYSQNSIETQIENNKNLSQ